MKQIKSIALLMMVCLTLALTGPTTAHAAAISPWARDEIISVFIVMLGRGPNQTELADLIAESDRGKTLVEIMSKVATTTEYANRYPGYMTGKEFAEKLTGILLGDNTSESIKTNAQDWIASQLRQGKTPVQLFVDATRSIRSTTATDYLAAKSQLADKVTAAITSASSSTPAATSQSPAPTPTPPTSTSGISAILKDLREIAEDLKIEEEDGSAFFKGGLKQASDKVAVLESRLVSAPESERAAIQTQLTQARTDLATLSKLPSAAEEKLKALETELNAATTDAQRQAVVQKLTDIQRTLSPWLSFAGNNLENPSGVRTTMTDDGLKNLRAINDRVLTHLTGGGNTCRTRYNSNSHAYETVCN
jgi:hypothetical protein